MRTASSRIQLEMSRFGTTKKARSRQTLYLARIRGSKKKCARLSYNAGLDKLDKMAKWNPEKMRHTQMIGFSDVTNEVEILKRFSQ